MRYYAYSSLVIGSEVPDVFEMTKKQMEYEMAAILTLGEGPVGKGEQ